MKIVLNIIYGPKFGNLKRGSKNEEIRIRKLSEFIGKQK